MNGIEQTSDVSPTVSSTLSSGAATAPADRSTSFQAVQGEPEHYSGATLLVTAYAALWAILLVWVGFVWRKQSALNVRLDDLDRVLKAAAARERKPAR